MSNWLEPFMDMKPGDDLQTPSGMIFGAIDEDGEHPVEEEQDGRCAWFTPIKLQELAQITNALYPNGALVALSNMRELFMDAMHHKEPTPERIKTVLDEVDALLGHPQGEGNG